MDHTARLSLSSEVGVRENSEMVEKQALSRVVIFELIQAVQINWELNALA